MAPCPAFWCPSRSYLSSWIKAGLTPVNRCLCAQLQGAGLGVNPPVHCEELPCVFANGFYLHLTGGGEGVNHTMLSPELSGDVWLWSTLLRSLLGCHFVQGSTGICSCPPRLQRCIRWSDSIIAVLYILVLWVGSLVSGTQAHSSMSSTCSRRRMAAPFHSRQPSPVFTKMWLRVRRVAPGGVHSNGLVSSSQQPEFLLISAYI